MMVFHEGAARGGALQLLQPPLQRPARSAVGRSGPAVVQAQIAAGALNLARDQQACVQIGLHHAARQKPPPIPRICASTLACMLSTVSTSWPLTRPKLMLLRTPGVGNGDQAVPQQLFVGDGLGCAGQRMVGRDGKDEVHLADFAGLQFGGIAGIDGNAYGQIGLAAGQRFQSAAENAVLDLQRRGRVQRIKASISSNTGVRAIAPSTTMVSWGSQPVATRLTRWATASISCSRRAPSWSKA